MIVFGVGSPSLRPREVDIPLEQSEPIGAKETSYGVNPQCSVQIMMATTVDDNLCIHGDSSVMGT